VASLGDESGYFLTILATPPSPVAENRSGSAIVRTIGALRTNFAGFLVGKLVVLTPGTLDHPVVDQCLLGAGYYHWVTLFIGTVVVG